MQVVLSGFSVRLFCFVQAKLSAFTSPVRADCDMFVMYCMQCCMSASAVL